MTTKLSAMAAQMGAKGGRSKSQAKREAVRKNLEKARLAKAEKNKK